MSVPVQLDQLREEIARFGSAAFLVTVRDGARPHVVSVRVEWEGERLTVGAGRRTADNVGDGAPVTLLWPAPDAEERSLLVDGEGRLDGERVLITPSFAILHRSVTGDGGARSSDCAEVGTPS